jgi:hypothetical protein
MDRSVSVTRIVLVLLAALLACSASSCTLLAGRTARVDSRTDLPGARPFDRAADELPGSPPAEAADLAGAWFLGERVEDVFVEGRPEPWLSYAIWIWLRQDSSYDLVYQAYWGSRGRNDPRFSGVDVRETGRFSVAAGVLSMEPEQTRSIEVRAGSRVSRTLDNESREYLARVDRGYLNLAGPCAAYQLEPICQRAREVWISLRSVATRSPEEVPEL